MADDLRRPEGPGDPSSESGSSTHAEGADQTVSGSSSESGDSPVYSSSSDPYGHLPATASVNTEQGLAAESTANSVPQPKIDTPAQVPARRTPPPPPPPSDSDTDEGDEEEQGMLRMSFMEYLEELRTRMLLALLGLV